MSYLKRIIRRLISQLIEMTYTERQTTFDSKPMNLNPKYSKYSIGDFTFDCNPTILGGLGNIKIGRFCSLGQNITLILGQHRVDYATTYPLDIILKKVNKSEISSIRNKGDIVIGNDVWIGANVTILPGVTIGDGAVVGAGSIVTRDVQPYTIVAGNPARLIRNRFDKETTERLLELKWWNWGIERIRENVDLLLSPNIVNLLEKNQS
jgi:virginiamycin A acetyltransferase